MAIEKDKPNVTVNSSVTIIPWFFVFLTIKGFGTALVDWSWWWILCPVIPSLFVVLGRLGLL